MSVTVVGSPLGSMIPLVTGSWLDSGVRSGFLSCGLVIKLTQKVFSHYDDNQTSVV